MPEDDNKDSELNDSGGNPGDSGSVDQSEIDRLLAAAQGGDEPQPPAEESAPEEAVGVDQAEIDRLMAAAQGGDEPQPPAEESAPEQAVGVDQAEIDRLIAAAQGGDEPQQPEEKAESEAEPQAAVDQSEIDRLMAIASSEKDDVDAGGADQKGIDDVLAGADMESPLGDKEGDPVVAEGEASESLDEELISALIQDEAVEESPGIDDGGVSQDIIDALIKAGGDETEAAESISQENLAAAAEAPGASKGLLSQEDLDKALEEGKKQKRKRPAPIIYDYDSEVATRAHGAGRRFVHENAVKVAGTLAAGLLVALSTFTYLYTHQLRIPTERDLAKLHTSTLSDSIQKARVLVEQGNHRGAIGELNRALEDAGGGHPLRADAEFVRLEAMYKKLDERSGQRERSTVHGAIDRLVSDNPGHPLAVNVLHWKANLYQEEDMPMAARSVYRHILSTYPSGPTLDKILLDASSAEMELNQPEKAADFLRRMLEMFPASPLVAEAKFRLGDTYAETGKHDRARSLYIQAAQAKPNSALAARALANLGKLSYEQGDYEGSIRQLEERLKLATTIEGNEHIYLQLAKAYRKANRLSDAEQRIRELIDFFPDNEVIPLAYVELSQVLDEMGRSKEAYRTASKAGLIYSSHPDVLNNNGVFLAKEQLYAGAARAFEAADRAGANVPAIALAAGKNFHKAEDLREAYRAFQHVMDAYPGSAEAFEASIEQGKVLYELGRIPSALSQLENLRTASKGKPQALPVQLALGDMYLDAGLTSRAAIVLAEAAANTNEPETIAKTAVALLKAGSWEKGNTIARRVDVSKLSGDSAYKFLMRHGEALLKTDSRAAIAKMEQAVNMYPDIASPEDYTTLLGAYFSTGQNAKARSAIMSLDPANLSDARLLLTSATSWGDHLFNRGDYRAAVDAYKLAGQAARKMEKDHDWAKFQEASSLLKLSDFDSSVALFDEVAKSNSKWAREAGLKAAYARVEQKLRGMPVTPVNEEG